MYPPHPPNVTGCTLSNLAGHNRTRSHLHYICTPLRIRLLQYSILTCRFFSPLSSLSLTFHEVEIPSKCSTRDETCIISHVLHEHTTLHPPQTLEHWHTAACLQVIRRLESLRQWTSQQAKQPCLLNSPANRPVLRYVPEQERPATAGGLLRKVLLCRGSIATNRMARWQAALGVMLRCLIVKTCQCVRQTESTQGPARSLQFESIGVNLAALKWVGMFTRNTINCDTDPNNRDPFFIYTKRTLPLKRINHQL